MITKIQKHIATLLLFCIFITMSTPTLAASAPSGISFSQLEDGIDAVVAEHLGKTTPGVAIVVVHEGEIIFSRGYGYANTQTQTPVDPATTVFEYGSMSKTFMWVAAMQLVELGLLDLDADVNTLLPKDLADEFAFEYPFTMRDLMNHTAGFAYSMFFKLPDAEQIETQGNYRDELLALQPKQIFEPGTVSSYSNFGTGLAGYIVGYLSGWDFDDYERQQILLPAGMTNTLNQPDWVGNHEFLQEKAKGYVPNPLTGELIEGPWSYIYTYPAGGLNGTAEDLANFMIALTPPADKSGPLFDDPNTLKTLFSSSSLDPITRPGMNHGFWRYGGALPAFGHPGNTSSFSALYAVVPEERFGFAVLANASQEGDIIYGISDLLLGNIKDKNANLESPAGLPNVEELEGRYDSAQTIDNVSFLTFIMQLLVPAGQVTAIDENTISLSSPLFPFSGTYRQTAPYTFSIAEADNPFMGLVAPNLYFRVEDGAVRQIHVGNAFDMMPQTHSVPILTISVVIAIICILFFIFMPILLFISFLINRKKETPNKRFNRFRTGLLLTGTLLVLNNLIALVRALATYALASDMNSHILMNFILSVLAIALFIGAWMSLRVGETRKRSKVLYGITATLMVSLLFVMYSWNFFVLL